MHIGSNIGFIAKMPCITFLAECATINVEFTKNLGEIYRNSMHQSLPTAALQLASGLQIRTLHLKILQDTYRHIAKAVLYCMEN